MMNILTAAGIVLVLVGLVGLALRWRWKNLAPALVLEPESTPQKEPSSNAVHIIHRLCPHHNVIQRYELGEKDSLDEHLDVLTKKLADKEGRLLLSKCKIRETQNEIENLHAIDQDVRLRYREIVESLRNDLQNNEAECKKLQEQIEWVSHRRAELKDEVHRGQLLYGEAAAEIANNLAEWSRNGKLDQRDLHHQNVTDKPKHQYTPISVRCRKEPHLPSPVDALNGKNSYQFSQEAAWME